MVQKNKLMGICRVDKDGWSFADGKTNELIVPFGVNYYDPDTGWAPKLWRLFDEGRVEQHFARMADFGVNVARVFTTCASFLPSKNTVDKDTLAKFDKLIDIATKHAIRLIVTGPDHWEGRPDYWQDDQYASEDTLAALTTFWSVLAERYKDEPAIFSWDLLNEPMIQWESEVMRRKWQTWLQEKYAVDRRLISAWGSLHEKESLAWHNISIPENKQNEGAPKLYDYQLFRESIARTWTETQVRAIRSAGDTHMVTIGYIQWSYPGVRGWGESQPGMYSAFNPRKLADLLDFNCLHFYPTLGDPIDPELKEQNTKYLQECLAYCNTGTPVILEEFGWYGGGAVDGKLERSQKDLDDWNSHVVNSTRGFCSGWLAWPYSDTPSSKDISKYGGIITSGGKEKPWGTSFRNLAKELCSRKPIKSEHMNPLVIDEADMLRLLTGRDNRNYH